MIITYNCVGTVRSCFKTDILLGTLSNPLKPSLSCNMRDITEDRSASTTACLCTTNLCNKGTGGDKQKKINKKYKQVAKEKLSKTPKTGKKKATTPQNTGQCPLGFEKVGTGCYYVSMEKVGWIEARKKCE